MFCTACTDPFCQEHKPVLHSYCQAICDCQIKSAEVCIPITIACKQVAGWNASACMLKHQAFFWHQLWIVCGSPSAGVTAEIKKRAKRWYNSNHNDLRGDKAIFVVKVWEIWEQQSVFNSSETEVQWLNRSKHAPTSQVIDGVSSDLQIVELWSAKCENLHNPCNPNKSVRVLENVICLSQRMILFLFQ